MKKILFCLLIFQSLLLSAQEQQQEQQLNQQQRSLTISASDTVVEHLMLPPGERGMEMPITLKLCYSETANTLTVIAESTGNIFGLQAGARYRNIIKRGHIFRRGGKFMAEKLPYDVEMDPNNTYRMGKLTRKSMGPLKVRKNYYFHRWIESDGMDARTAKTPLLGKQLVQVFSLAPGQDKATFSLRDIFTVERKGATPKKWKKLLLTLHHDINITYNLQILHDPCLDMEEKITAAKEQLQKLDEGLKKLNAEYSAENPLSPALYTAFMNHRDSLISAFPHQSQNSTCPELQETYDKYNELVESIMKQHRELNVPSAPAPAPSEVVGNLLGEKHLDANSLQFKARQLDELVGRWMLSKDGSERNNIRRQCQKIINDAAKLADGKVIKTDDQRHAVRTFQKALEFYRKNVR